MLASRMEMLLDQNLCQATRVDRDSNLGGCGNLIQSDSFMIRKLHCIHRVVECTLLWILLTFVLFQDVNYLLRK